MSAFITLIISTFTGNIGVKLLQTWLQRETPSRRDQGRVFLRPLHVTPRNHRDFTGRLTGLGVFQDPVQQLLLWQVAELPNDGPLGLEVGHALDRHEGQEQKHRRPVLQFVPDPSKQLRRRRREGVEAALEHLGEQTRACFSSF